MGVMSVDGGVLKQAVSSEWSFAPTLLCIRRQRWCALDVSLVSLASKRHHSCPRFLSCPKTKRLRYMPLKNVWRTFPPAAQG